jgi:hypothetical protein
MTMEIVMRTTTALLCLVGFLALPAGAQVRSSFATVSSGDPPTMYDPEADAFHAHITSGALPSAGKMAKRTGIGTLIGTGAGAAFTGVFLAATPHTDHDEAGLAFAAFMLVGATAGAVVGFVSAFVS